MVKIRFYRPQNSEPFLWGLAGWPESVRKVWKFVSPKIGMQKSAKIPLCELGNATLTLIWAARGEGNAAPDKKQMQ